VATLRAFGAGIFVWENGLRVLHAIGAHDDVACTPRTRLRLAARWGSAVRILVVSG